MSKGKIFYALLMLEKGEGEMPLHSLAKPLIYVFRDDCHSDLPKRLPLIKDIER